VKDPLVRQRDGWAFKTPAGSRFLRDPELFAVYSTSGNQWRKLMYFWEDWQDLNLLVSMYDVYRSDTSLIREMYRLGLRGHMAALRQRVGRRVLSKRLPQYAAYHQYIRLEKPFAHQGLLMLDSGGFSFGEPKKLHPLLKSPLPSIQRFARLMLAISELESQAERWNARQFIRMARAAQRYHLRAQLRLKPDIVITLDRVMHYELPYWMKLRRLSFNLACARTALELFVQTPEPRPLLFPVIHPAGPAWSEIGKEISPTAAEEHYTRTFTLQFAYLLRLEKRVGIRFGGFAVGSLVPVRNPAFLRLLARAVWRAVTACGVDGRPLHAFGASDNKMLLLSRYGFTSFDSSLHIVKARNRQIYDPDTGNYKKLQPPARCQCPVCSRHSADELLENRPGVKEVATVLQSLHNFYANHRVHLETLRRSKKSGKRVVPAPLQSDT